MKEIIEYQQFNLSQEETKLLFEVAKSTLFPKEKELCYDLLLKANMGLVFAVLRNYKSEMEYKELFNQGILALRNVIEKYDMSHGTQFNTYAYQDIAHRIKRYTAQNRTTITVPIHILESLSKMSKDTDDESTIGENLESSEENLNHLKDFYLTKGKVEVVENDEEDVHEESHNINDESMERLGYYAPFEDVIKRDSFGYLHQKIKSLDTTEQHVIIRRFGLNGKSETLKEVAHGLNISGEMVRKIEETALKKLRMRVDKASVL